MFLSNFSIKQPLAVVVIIIVLMGFGLLAMTHLRVNQLPDVDLPLIVVTVPFPGASPETVEREIIDHLEKSLLGIPKIDQLQSTASEGEARIVLIFDFEKDMVLASDEIRNVIASVRHQLPLDMREPILQHTNPFARPIMLLALSSSTLSLADLSVLAEDSLSDRLRGIDGVSTVTINGALKRELSVFLKLEKLREFNVSVAEVVNALRTQNVTVPVGSIKGALTQQSIRLVGRVESIPVFKQIVVKNNGDKLVRLGQVADVDEGFSESSSYSFRDGKANVGISIARARDASTISVAEDVRSMVKKINSELNAGTQLEITLDGGVDAELSLNQVIEALLFGALLTIFVVYIFLNSWRSTIITALSLPISVVASFIAIWASGFSLNFMTLLALSLAIGVLIDDAIVVRENIVRHLEKGADRMTAASRGTQEIGLAVTATTFSIMAVFVPVAFLSGSTGAYFGPFALTVASSVLISLLVSFTLDPMISAYWGDPIDHRSQPKKGLSKKLASFNTWFDQQADRYVTLVVWALRRHRLMAAMALISFVAALVLQSMFGGTSFMPASDSGFVAVKVRTPSSASLEYSKLKVERAASLAHTLKETVATSSTVTAGGGLIYIDIGRSTDRDRSAAEVATDVRQLLSQLVGAEYTVFDDLNNGTEKPVNIQFYGADSRRLITITTAFMEELAKVPGAVDVGLSELEPKDELKVDLDRNMANALGISVNDAAQALRVAFAGVEVGQWIDSIGESRDVAIRLHPDDRVNTTNIEHLPIPVLGTQNMVPLNQIATFTMGKGPSQIEHMGGERVITVSANTQGISPGELTAKGLKIAERIDFPEGYGIKLGGASRNQAKIFGDMATALVMGILLMYLILVVQFGSFTVPIAVMLSLPLSLIGVVLALLGTGCTLNLMSLIGIIMLMGLVAKNAILLLECARKVESEGQGRVSALLQAGRERLRPIMMTTFALIAGMLPVAIGHGEGSEFFRPMAVSIIGGVITSTLLTLLVVPTLYDSIETSRERMMAKYRIRVDRWNPPMAFFTTLFEAVLTLIMLRWILRRLLQCVKWIRPASFTAVTRSEN